jgi:hypothetical protein
MPIYLIVRVTLFSGAVSNSGYIALNGWLTVGKDMAGSGPGSIEGPISTLA